MVHPSLLSAKTYALILSIIIVPVSSLFVFSSAAQSASPSPSPQKIVLIAGPKTHPPAMHEYIKTVRLLKAMLDSASNLDGIETTIVYNGWPEDETILDDADLVMMISDGQDGDIGYLVPFMEDDRMRKMAALIERGCGLMTFHFSTFAPDRLAPEILAWTGGYFDWENDRGEREWYSAITTLEADVNLSSPAHPILNGVRPYRVQEEFYFNMRFPDHRQGWTPILDVPALDSDRENGNVVAWAVEREDGGRGFGTTTGHYYANWKNDDYRKLILNAIVWTAGGEVPVGGIESQFYTDDEVTQRLFGAGRKGLILTGNNHPAHDWRRTTRAISEAIEADARNHIDVSTNIEDLGQYDLRDYDFLVLNYANWEDPAGLSDAAKEGFIQYLMAGGGLLVLHFANGAFHYSLPEAGASDWPEYRNIVRRVWDHSSDSGHDAYGEFTVNVTDQPHEITRGLGSFSTTDELYYNQKGDAVIQPLLTAHSKDTGMDEPLAWTYSYGRGRVFQMLLGHNESSLKAPEIQTILKRAASWAADGFWMYNDL